MKKIFILSGELSGDLLGAWYLRNFAKNTYCEAVGGSFLQDEGAALYERIEKLGFVGVAEIVKHLPFIFRFLDKVSRYIVDQGFDEVVLVDFPGFNLMVARRLKRLKKDLKITYLSPPQLWVWGAWRVKKIRKRCDEVVVLYPFEVEWYKKRGVKAKWLGYPFYGELEPYFNEEKVNKIALLPGSRVGEVKALMPYFVAVIKKFKKKYPDVKFVLPLAESINKKLLEKFFLENSFQGNSFPGWEKEVEVVRKDKLKKLAGCALAIAKPGTASLQLSILKVPTVLIYKASGLTYRIAKLVVRVKWMGLANLLLNKEVSRELIQKDCTPENIFSEASKIYDHFLNKHVSYDKSLKDLSILREILYSDSNRKLI